ncbi:hypothetical protein RSOLAG1IB_10618 [Rhizoctonia solani AG-1 IB]|uniref:Uncharacterized protein n=1 Tax=Thanatephorus cucumeris (strain AG1-IB / isolate 7/3/14) TaxID=1108050 RepID=A0A0B7FYE5_THACB|nr:hypothetical protein RSOLAG1IB_10618 [Rhizoctonia solani AG-1 IB]
METVQGRPDPDQDEDDKCYKDSLVDAQDARTFLSAFVRRVLYLQTLPPALSALLLRFIRQKITMNIHELVVDVIRGTCSRIWHILELSADDVDSDHSSTYVGFNQYAMQLFSLIDRFCSTYSKSPAVISSIAETLFNIDFVELFGRLVLLSLSVGSPLGALSQSQ